MAKPYTGGCACGALRYEISGAPLVMADCQCRDCQRESGTGHGSYLTFARSGVAVTGEAAHWDMLSDTANVKTRTFCPVCGSPVSMNFARKPEVFAIHAASLDEPGRYKPQMVIYTVSGEAWDHRDPALPTFERMPAP